VKRKPSSKKTKKRIASSKNVAARKERPKMPLVNLLVAVMVWLAIVVLFYSGRFVRPQKLSLGQQASDTFVASVDFNAETIAATELKQRERAGQVVPVFSIDRSGIDNAQRALAKLLPRLRALKLSAEPEQQAIVKDLLDLLSISLTPEQLLRLIPPDPVDLQPIILNELTGPIENGIVSELDLSSRFNGVTVNGNVTVRGENAETIRRLDSFFVRPDILQKTVAAIAGQLPRENRDEEVIRTLITPWLHPNLVYDAAETGKRKTQAIDLINPVIDTVAAGSVLIRKGDPVSAQTLAWLDAHEKRISEMETPAERIQRMAASGLLLLIGLGLTAAAGGIIDRTLLRNTKKILLLLTLSVLPLLLGKMLLYFSVTLQLLPPTLIDYSVPLAVAPMLASILAGGPAGILTGLWSSFALASLLGNSFEVLVLGLLITVTAVYTTRDVKKRTLLFRAGLWIGAMKICFALILAVLNQPAWQVLLPQLGTALISGLAGALLAMLLIPVFEHLFNITTDIKLLELSDLSHPLLQSLAINAPGTYHHSLMMASLAQNAAESIGANGLQLRVCAYFHDIGKLVKPGFFSENIQFTENPHDDLAPSMSTLVIVSHIKEGVTLAKKYKLPQVIIDGIEQHQGTSLVSVFYHRAKTLKKKEQASANSPAGQVNDEDFRYEGPRPQNREMAILMLADSCEAASRSLDKPTPVRIANLISEIFQSRLKDGQLDQCDLTLAELNTVRESFIFSLTNMLHGRVAYPKNEEENPKNETPNDRKNDEARNTQQ
jgi:putative nucleotidyltransferase with HDIG domain